MIKCIICNGNMAQVQAPDLSIRDKNFQCIECKFSMYKRDYLEKKCDLSGYTISGVNCIDNCPACGSILKQVDSGDGNIMFCQSCDSYLMEEHTFYNLEPKRTIGFADAADRLEITDSYDYDRAMREIEYDAQRRRSEYKTVETEIDYNYDEYMNLFDMVLAFFGLPIKDKNIKLTGSAYVTLFLMVACIEFFVLSNIGNYDEIIRDFGFVPARPFHFFGLTIISSMFMHGGIWHLISNLYFLFIYGDGVEAKLGKVKYIILVVLSGLIGLMLHSLVNLHSDIPLIGISGAVSGIAVFFTILHPNAKFAFLPFFWFQLIFMRGNYWWLRIKAKYILAIWLFFQILNGIGSGDSGVAFFAHIGGAICGFIMALVFNPKIDEEKQERVYSNMTR